MSLDKNQIRSWCQEVKDALLPLAYLDLKGLEGEVLFQNNHSKITREHVRRALDAGQVINSIMLEVLKVKD